MADDTTQPEPTIPLLQRYEALVLSERPSEADLRAMAVELRAAAGLPDDQRRQAARGADLPQAAQGLLDRAHDCESRIRGARSLRAFRLSDAAQALRQVRTTGATIHDMATIIGLTTMAADIARKHANDELADDDWRIPWLDRAEIQLLTYQQTGLAGWRRAYCGR